MITVFSFFIPITWLSPVYLSTCFCVFFFLWFRFPSYGYPAVSVTVPLLLILLITWSFNAHFLLLMSGRIFTYRLPNKWCFLLVYSTVCCFNAWVFVKFTTEVKAFLYCIKAKKCGLLRFADFLANLLTAGKSSVTEYHLQKCQVVLSHSVTFCKD